MAGVLDPLAAFQQFEVEAVAAIEAAATADALEQVRITFLGKKQGRLKDLQQLLGQAPPEARKALGERFNAAKDRVSAAWETRSQALQQPDAIVDAIDVTLPGTAPRQGRIHPISQTIADFKEMMGRFGFEVVEGPELEDDWHNFGALNIPLEHPARDPLDNFFLATAAIPAGLKSPATMIRSQTSTVQIRVMERQAPPVRVVHVGRVYRPDAIDMTHHVMFHQMEGLLIDRGITMASLKTTLRLFATAYLGQDVTIRFRPSFFPFTEPSVEVDMGWNGNWVEIGGAGMVDPFVLKSVGYDPEEVTGFAFGLGIERFCMRRHEVKDIRLFTQNDVRFLSQF